MLQICAELLPPDVGGVEGVGLEPCVAAEAHQAVPVPEKRLGLLTGEIAREVTRVGNGLRHSAHEGKPGVDDHGEHLTVP